MIQLVKAGLQDCGRIHAMQAEAFADLLEKYHDVETSPAAEPLEKVEARMAREDTDYYFIQADGRAAGAVRVQRLPERICRVSPIFILPQFQGKGCAQAAMRALEDLYPEAEKWRLDTIKEEAKLRHLYEKLGYGRTGREEALRPGMTAIYYEKTISPTEKEHE